MISGATFFARGLVFNVNTLTWDTMTQPVLEAGSVTIPGTVTVTGALTDTQLRATAVPISGTVTANAGTGTLAVSGPLTDSQLRATAVPVSGTVTANAGTGTLAVSGPLTDTQLRATAVPVSGTVTANAGTGTLAVSGPLTDTQLRATAVPVSGTVTANAGTGTFQIGDAGAVINLDVAGDVQVDVLTLPALVAGTANIGDVDVLTLPALVAGSANIGDVDVLTVPAPLSTSGGGTEATALRVTLASDSTGLVSVDDNAGTLTVDAPVGTPVATRLSDGAAFLTTTSGRLSVDASAVAHDAADSGNPVKDGGRASTAQIAAVASGDRTDAIYDVHGRQMVRLGHQNFAGNIWTAIHVPAANTQATATKASAGAGVRNVATALTVVLAATATAPTAVNLAVNLIDGAAGGATYLWRATISLPATAGAMNGIALSGLWLPGTAATAMTLEFSAAGGANTIESVSMSGVTVAE